MGKLVRDTVCALTYRATWGGSQDFLGARWVERVVAGMPESARERVALRFLALSPHYFYDRDLAAEADRNRQSRQVPAEELVVPQLAPDTRVLDCGCGPGYLAAAVRPGGTLLLHFAMADNGYRTEADWLAGGSLAGRAKLRYGLKCFARSAAGMTGLVTRAGFTGAVVQPLRGKIAIPGDDIPGSTG